MVQREEVRVDERLGDILLHTEVVSAAGREDVVDETKQCMLTSLIFLSPHRKTTVVAME